MYNYLQEITENGAGAAKSKGSKQSVERIYQKKSQLEHILLRPDSYIGKVFIFHYYVTELNKSFKNLFLLFS